MDQEEYEIDKAEWQGKATAALCVQAALVAQLVSKKLITRDEAASLAAAASQALQEIPGLSEDAKTLGESAIKGFSQSWSKLVVRH